MLTSEERRHNQERFEQELALATHAIRASYAAAYESFVYVGTAAARAAALEQWRAADEVRIERAVAREAERLRLVYPHEPEEVTAPRTEERRSGRVKSHRWMRHFAGMF